MKHRRFTRNCFFAASNLSGWIDLPESRSAFSGCLKEHANGYPSFLFEGARRVRARLQQPGSHRHRNRAVDVNALLQTHYSTSEPVRLTKTMLWDAEAKKAWDPMTYIPGVVRVGSSWGRKALGNGEECFLRESQQLAWRADSYGQVLEEVYVSPRQQSVLFFGRAEFLRDDGSHLQAGSHQPLFHVEHAVVGTDAQPENVWRIVHLTSKRDDILIEKHLGHRRVLRSGSEDSSGSTSKMSLGSS